MPRINGDIDDAPSLDTVTGSRRLLQDTIRWKITYESRIAHFYLQASICQDALCISKILVSDIRNRNRLTMMRVNIDAKLDTDAKQYHDDSHGKEISP